MLLGDNFVNVGYSYIVGIYCVNFLGLGNLGIYWYWILCDYIVLYICDI